MSLYSKVLHVKDTGGTVYNIPLYTSSSDNDLGGNPAPIIMDGQTLYAPYCAEDDEFASPLHCKMNGTTYRLQKQKLTTGMVSLIQPEWLRGSSASNLLLHASGGVNTIFKINITYADFVAKTNWYLNHHGATWWKEDAHSDPWTRSFYVKISPNGVYELASMFVDVNKVQSWTATFEYSPTIEAYGLANGVSATDTSPDMTYSDYKATFGTVTAGSISVTSGTSFTVPSNVHVMKFSGTSIRTSKTDSSGNITYDYGTCTGTGGIVWYSANSTGNKTAYIGVTPSRTMTLNYSNFSDVTVSYSDTINAQSISNADY